MNTGTNFMNFENLNKLIEERKKEIHPYKNYEFDNTNYTLLLIDINNLLKENQELKKQLEERTKMYQNAYNYSQKMETKAIILETQQKEFIKYLEDEMNKCQSNIFADGVKYGFQLSLSKYKKIIGVSDEKVSN